MTREDPQIKLRLPADLRDRIKYMAQRNGRSMNAEIVRVLEDEFPPSTLITVSEMVRELDELLNVAPQSESSNIWKQRKGLRDFLVSGEFDPNSYVVDAITSLDKKRDEEKH